MTSVWVRWMKNKNLKHIYKSKFFLYFNWSLCQSEFWVMPMYSTYCTPIRGVQMYSTYYTLEAFKLRYSRPFDLFTFLLFLICKEQFFSWLKRSNVELLNNKNRCSPSIECVKDELRLWNTRNTWGKIGNNLKDR